MGVMNELLMETTLFFSDIPGVWVKLEKETMFVYRNNKFLTSGNLNVAKASISLIHSNTLELLKLNERSCLNETN